MRDKQLDVMLAFAAVGLVMASWYQPRFLFYPAQYFHAGLVFFVAGHAATPRRTLREKLRFLGAELPNRLGRLFAWSALFAGVAFALARGGLALGWVPDLSSGREALASLLALLAGPFTGATAPALLGSAWILAQLAVASLLFQLVFWGTSPALGALVLVAAFGAAAVLIGAEPAGPGAASVAARTAFAFLFFVLGHVVSSAGDRVRRLLVGPAAYAAGFVVVDVLAANSGELGLAIDGGGIHHPNPAIPLLATATILLMVHAIAVHTARLVRDDGLLTALGRSSFHVLVWHQAVFLLVNVAFRAAGHLQPGDLARLDVSYRLNATWLLYLAPALVLPVLWRRATEAIGRRPAPDLT